MKSNDKVKLLSPAEAILSWRRATRTFSSDLHGNKKRGVDGGEAACAHENGESGPCCRRHAVVLPGYGKRDYPFPTPEELLAAVIQRFNELRRLNEEREAKESEHDHDHDHEDGHTHERHVERRRKGPLEVLGLGRSVARPSRRKPTVFGADIAMRGRPVTGSDAPKKLIPETDGKESQTNGPVLRIAAGTLAYIMHEGRDKAVIARQFDPLRGSVNWALTQMPAKFRPAKYKDTAASLKDQLDKLVFVYRGTLPRLSQFLGAQFPHASEEELLEAAVTLLNEQLAEILTVLSIWTDSFAQRRDGMYTQLDYVHFVVEQALRLFQTGDAHAREEKGIKTHAFHVGDVFMARFSDQGPSTIPGGRGPVGAHAIDVPHDEQDVIVIYSPLYTHEFRHDYFTDVEGLSESMAEAVSSAIKKADKEGKFKFSSDKLMLGKQAVPLINLIIQAMVQTLPETDADIAGGVSLTGEAYGYSMLATFSAFNIRGQNPVAVNRMLRHSSVYMVGNEGELYIEPHLPDYIRVYAVAAALDAMGFPAQAEEFRRLADQAAGVPKPTHIIWRNIDPTSKYKFEIKIAVDDLKQVLPCVIDAILNAPLPALNGLSTSAMVNWTAKRQAKVDALVANLVKGSSVVPTDLGDIWATYVAAAATKAVWTLWKSGEVPPMLATERVEEAARKMMDQVKGRFEEQEAQAEAARPTVTLPPEAATPTQPARETDITGPGGVEGDGERGDGDEEGDIEGGGAGGSGDGDIERGSDPDAGGAKNQPPVRADDKPKS